MRDLPRQHVPTPLRASGATVVESESPTWPWLNGSRALGLPDWPLRSWRGVIVLRAGLRQGGTFMRLLASTTIAILALVACGGTPPAEAPLPDEATPASDSAS